MIRIVLAILALGVIAAWALYPTYRRWYDHLKDAPELQDAGWKTRLSVAFSGLRMNVVARFTEALGAVSVASNVIGEMLGSGGVDLSAILPAIPLGDGRELAATQYAPIALIVLGRLNVWLRDHTSTPSGKIDPDLAVAVATQSQNVEGSIPSPKLAAVTDIKTEPEIETIRIAGSVRTSLLRQKRRKARPTAKRRRKAKAA